MIDSVEFGITQAAVANEALNPKTPEVHDLEKILRGEVSAVEAYRQVLEKFRDFQHANDLRRIQFEHERAVDFWKNQLRTQESLVEEASGPWGTIVETFLGVAKLLGDGPTLHALKNGEEHGLKEYRELLEADHLNEECVSFVKSVCLNLQRQHIFTLESLIRHS